VGELSVIPQSGTVMDSQHDACTIYACMKQAEEIVGTSLLPQEWEMEYIKNFLTQGLPLWIVNGYLHIITGFHQKANSKIQKLKVFLTLQFHFKDKTL